MLRMMEVWIKTGRVTVPDRPLTIKSNASWQEKKDHIKLKDLVNTREPKWYQKIA